MKHLINIYLRILLSILASGIVLLGCLKSKAPLSDLELYDRGTNAFEKDQYQKSREYFQQIEDLYPDSQYLAIARVGIANTYYQESNYSEAIIAYQKVLEFYPMDKLAEWSQYRIGLSHFWQMLPSDRDQEETNKACTAFEKFLTQYPKSQLIEEAKAKYQVCQDRLADNEMYIARFYFKNKAYEAAINRLQGILMNYPQFTGKDEVFYYLAKSYRETSQKELEQETINTLIKEYRDSEFIKKLRKE